MLGVERPCPGHPVRTGRAGPRGLAWPGGLLAGIRIKTDRSHLSVNDRAHLLADGGVNAGSSPLPEIEEGDAVEAERVVSKDVLVTLGSRMLLAAEILSGRKVGIRIEADTLMFYELETRELLRARANPLSFD